MYKSSSSSFLLIFSLAASPASASTSFMPSAIPALSINALTLSGIYVLSILYTYSSSTETIPDIASPIKEYITNIIIPGINIVVNAIRLSPKNLFNSFFNIVIIVFFIY